jgi:hypothetical protein
LNKKLKSVKTKLTFTEKSAYPIIWEKRIAVLAERGLFERGDLVGVKIKNYDFFSILKTSFMAL